jgi:hypothetical protein
VSKGLKIFISALALFSIVFSVTIIFGWKLFSGKKIVPQEVITEPTLTPEEIALKKSTSSCIVLDEEYCSQGKLIYEENQLIGLGFKVPEETLIYAPFKGILEVNVLQEINDSYYNSLDLLDTSEEDYGFSEKRTLFTPLGYFQAVSEINSFEKAQALGKVGSLTINKQWGDYNLVLLFRVFNLKDDKWSIESNLLKQFFPNLEIEE